MLGIGVDASVYAWIEANAPAYLGEDYYIGKEGDYYWFYELPDTLTWDDDTGAVYTVSTRPSQQGVFIGNLAG